jgi:hypothetical protein
MSYPGVLELFNFRDDSERCQFGLDPSLATRCDRPAINVASKRMTKSSSSAGLLRGFVEFFHPVAILKDFARLCAIGRPDDAVLLHKVNQARRASIPNP